MSVCLLSCPLCVNPYFKNVDELRNGLIDVATKTLRCPICDETVLGLDKLTIHLFVHTKDTSTKPLPDKSVDKLKKETSGSERKVEGTHANKRSRQPCSKTKVHQPANMQTKLVKIYPKLPMISLNTVPIIGIAQNRIDDTVYTKTLVCNQTGIAENPTGLNSNNLSGSQANAYNCDICGLNFVDENILSMHKILIHNMEETKVIEKISRFPCHLCNKSFKMKGSLMVHLRVAHYGVRQSHFLHDKILQNGGSGQHIINNSDSNGPEKEEALANDRADNKQWSCDTCHKSFTTKYFLKKHKRLHTGETPYACTQCNKTFTFQQSYHKHLLYHNDEKPHTCNQCGRSFKELSTLHNHQRIHTGEKPFSCETCGKCFRQRVSYLVHRRIHTGVTPYKCTACDKSFRYKVSQRTHKCAAQPPGTIVRQACDLVQKILQNKSNNEMQSTNGEVAQTVNVSLDLSSAKSNEDLIRSGAKLSLEDIEVENFALVPEKEDSLLDGIVDESYVKMQFPTTFQEHMFNDSSVICDLNNFVNNPKDEEKSMPSPSEILKNLCISSYDEMLISSDSNKIFSLI